MYYKYFREIYVNGSDKKIMLAIPYRLEYSSELRLFMPWRSEFTHYSYNYHQLLPAALNLSLTPLLSAISSNSSSI
jgi:hypothetical protein